MKHFFTLLAVALLMLCAAQQSHASKGYTGLGYGGYAGYAGAGYGHLHGASLHGCPHCARGGYGHGHGHGYGHGYGYGHGHGYGHHPCECHPRYHGFHRSLYNVPMMTPPAYQAGPPTAAVTYPYYTVRGPRDFLQDGCGPNPILPYRRPTICLPSIGP